MAKNAENISARKSYNVIGVIPARGGSVGVPLKNIHELNGKPLISYVIKAALGSRHLKRVIVSTDHPKIAEISRECGAEVPFKRPTDISADVPTEFVIQHAVNFVEAEESRRVDIVVTMQATTPVLNSRDIDATIEEVMEHDIDSAITVKEVREYPWWMMEITGEGLLKPFLTTNLSGDVTVRQNLAKLYLPNGAVYATRREVLMTENRIIGQRCGAVVMPEERSVDIDSLLDFKIIETIIREGNVKPSD